MSLSTLIPVLSILALLVTLLQTLVDKTKWKRLAVLAAILFCVNGATQIGTAIVANRQKQADAIRALEQQAANRQIIDEVAALNQTAAAAFEKLTRTVSLLPRSTAIALTEEARAVQGQLNAVTRASVGPLRDEATTSQLKELIEKTHSGLQHLSDSINTQAGYTRSPAPARIEQTVSSAATAQPTASRPAEALNTIPAAGSAPHAASVVPAVLVSGAPGGSPTSPSRVRAVPILLEDSGFVPSGFMGDATTNGALVIDEHSHDSPYSAPDCQKLTYVPGRGHDGWAALAWQFPNGNWGDQPGKDWKNRGFTEVSIRARGVPDRRGRLPIVQFKAGGNTNPSNKYQASFAVEGVFVTLTADWKSYALDLRGKDLSQVIAAFVVVLRAADHESEATFYIDNVEYR